MFREDAFMRCWNRRLSMMLLAIVAGGLTAYGQSPLPTPLAGPIESISSDADLPPSVDDDPAAEPAPTALVPLVSPVTSLSTSALPAAAAPAPAKPKPPVQPWKGVFYDNDFSYKKDPNHTPLLGENLKDMRVGEDTLLSIGGEFRWRYMDEVNRLRPPFQHPGRSVYDLLRMRNYLDLKHSDWVRLYVEMINSDIYNNDLPVTGIDRNRVDLQNAFVDLKVLERNDKPVWFRAGRQELLFGSQRLISPLDWANVRRNFQGFRINSPGTDWDLDAWLVNPVNTATAGDGDGISPTLGVNYLANRFDPANHNITFGGGWATYKAIKDHTIDTFFLWADYSGAFPGGTGIPIGDRYTYGHRWAGTFNVDGGTRAWLTDIEGGYQFGDNQGRAVQAGFVTTGFGHYWKDVMWEPKLWGFYDWASGGNPKSGTDHTFFQYYGLTHAYMGLIDNLARQNISDVNWRLELKPTAKLNLQAAQHFFQLANTNDYLYTVNGQAFSTVTNKGRNVGNELDLVATYTVNPNLSFETGFFQFWYGDYIENVSPRGNAQQYYFQTTVRY